MPTPSSSNNNNISVTSQISKPSNLTQGLSSLTTSTLLKSNAQVIKKMSTSQNGSSQIGIPKFQQKTTENSNNLNSKLSTSMHQKETSSDSNTDTLRSNKSYLVQPSGSKIPSSFLPKKSENRITSIPVVHIPPPSIEKKSSSIEPPKSGTLKKPSKIECTEKPNTNSPANGSSLMYTKITNRIKSSSPKLKKAELTPSAASQTLKYATSIATRTTITNLTKPSAEVLGKKVDLAQIKGAEIEYKKESHVTSSEIVNDSEKVLRSDEMSNNDAESKNCSNNNSINTANGNKHFARKIQQNFRDEMQAVKESIQKTLSDHDEIDNLKLQKSGKR